MSTDQILPIWSATNNRFSIPGAKAPATGDTMPVATVRRPTRMCPARIGAGIGSLSADIAEVLEDGSVSPGGSATPTVRAASSPTVSYTHLRAHETRHDLVCRLL